MRNPFLARLTVAVIVAGPFLSAPQGAEAQDANRIYSLSEVSAPPEVRSASAAASAINRSYPEGLRSVGGRVQLRFVVRPDGKVDPRTIEVIVASATQLGEAATRAVQQIDFRPAQLNGVAVSTMVVFPITYTAR